MLISSSSTPASWADQPPRLEFVPVHDIFGQALDEIEHGARREAARRVEIGVAAEQHSHRVDLIGAGRAGKRRALIVGAAGVYVGAGFEQQAGALGGVGALAGPIDQAYQQRGVAVVAGGGEAGVLGKQRMEGVEVARDHRGDGAFVGWMEVRLDHRSLSGRWMGTGGAPNKSPPGDTRASAPLRLTEPCRSC